MITARSVTGPFLTDFDLHLWSEGSHVRAYEKMGAHIVERDGVQGTHFAVWAPNARHVSVVGDFNDWQTGLHPLKPRGVSGIWEGFIPRVGVGALYKYTILSQFGNYYVTKADPFAFASEIRPQT